MKTTKTPRHQEKPKGFSLCLCALVVNALLALVAAPAWATNYNANLSETNIASDSIARLAAFGRTDNDPAVTWTHVNGARNSTAPSTTTVSLGWTPAHGSLLVFGCVNEWASSFSVSDNSSGPADVWTTIVPNTSGNVAIQGWATIVTTGTAPTSVTCTESGGTTWGIAIVDNYTANGYSFSVDGSAAVATGSSTTPNVAFTTGASPGDLLWSFGGTTYQTAGISVASPFSFRESYNGQPGAMSADDGISAGVSASTLYTATYTNAQGSYPWACAIVGFQASRISDQLSRAAAFGRGPSESNTASDAIARSAAYLTEAVMSEANTASDALARHAGLGRGPSENNPASDSIARAGILGRAESEGSATSDMVGRAAVYSRAGAESNPASDALARQLGFGRGPSESNTASDSISRLGIFCRTDSENHTASDAIVRLATYQRGESETNIALDTIARERSAWRALAEVHSVSEVVGFLRVAGRHRDVVPGQTKTGSEPGRVKSGAAPAH